MWVLVHHSGTCTVFKAAVAELNFRVRIPLSLDKSKARSFQMVCVESLITKLLFEGEPQPSGLLKGGPSYVRLRGASVVFSPLVACIMRKSEIRQE